MMPGVEMNTRKFGVPVDVDLLLQHAERDRSRSLLHDQRLPASAAASEDARRQAAARKQIEAIRESLHAEDEGDWL